ESSPQDPETGDEGGESDDFPEEGSAQEPASSENSDDDGDGQAPSEQSPEPQAQEDESESNQQDPETGDTVEPIFDFANWLIANAPSTADDPPLTVAFAPSKDQAIRPNAALLRVAEALTASYSRKTGSVKKGKGQAIRTNNLALVETGLPIFGRRATTLGSAAHYVLLLDQSGSMSPIWDSAVECTMTMANAMERVGDVRVEVMTYYRNVEWDGDSQTLTMKDCRINHVVDRKRYPDIRPEGTTPTADALAYAWDTLKPSRYERKGIIVITDGIADTEHSGLSRQIEDSGVELYAIGLGVTDSAFLQHNFSRWVTASIAELPTKLMQALSPAA
ncbi:VWA domain-containing protein, partial [Acidithiobacillus caldus ATCC 51756]|uniref:vWA domain-containing protein n=2 Tax=Acidithiobacillus caldus TaxID=33059 RepID=UPI001C0680B7